MALPDFRINPYVQPYVGSISNEFRQGVQEKIQAYEAAIEQDDVLGYQKDTLLQNVGPFQNDIAFANKLISDTRSSIEERALRGDYENMFREIRRNARNFSAQAQPLLTNKKLYDEYRTQLASMKDVDEVTKNKALQYSVNNYKGLDPNNPSTSFFRGYTPAKTINIADALDKFYTGWKADKGSRDVINADGTISKMSWEQAQKGNGVKSGAQIMQEAGQAYIKSNPEIGDYANTQLTVGNQDRLGTEINDALNSNLQKHFYSATQQEIGFVPEWMRKEQTEVEQPIYSSPSSVSDNIHVKNAFDGSKLLIDGRLGIDTKYYGVGSNGVHYKYVDKSGNILPIEEVRKDEQASVAAGSPVGLLAQGINRVNATPQEVQLRTNSINKDFDKLVIDTYADDFAPAEYQGSEQLKTAWAQNRLNNIDPSTLKTYRKEVLDRYNKMQGNTVVETQKWNKQKVTDVKLVGDIEQISDAGVLASSLSGREVQLLSKPADVKVNLVAGNDINELYKQLEEDGWRPSKLNDNGLLKYNPKMNTPGSSVTLKVEKGTGEDKQYRDLEIAVGIPSADQAPQLQVLQNIMQKALSGNSGFIGVNPNSKAGYYVKVTPGKNIKEGKVDRNAKVVRIDSDGNQINTIAIDAFPDFYMQNNPYANQELRRFVTTPKDGK